MPIKSLPNQDRVHTRPTQRRNDSGELDVFEATRYFSNEIAADLFSHKAMREERQAWGGRRYSLDMAPTASLPLQTHHQQVQKQSTNQKHHKQPSSPGGRLASFLNSLFHQTPSKKKKSKPSTTQSMREDESVVHGGRRKRRSSISLFQTSHTSNTKSVYASSTASGFRTPPPYVVSLPFEKPKSQNVGLDEKRKMDIAWLDEKFKYIQGVSEKDKNKFSFDKKRCGEVDDGGESDSSSDLFELENYDLGVYSSDLPVYKTTHLESLKRGAPISNDIL